MEASLTISIQDYLKHIYELTEGGENASTNALSERLNVTEPAPMAVGLESPLADIVRDIGRSGNFRLADPGFLLFLVLLGVHVFI